MTAPPARTTSLVLALLLGAALLGYCPPVLSASAAETAGTETAGVETGSQLSAAESRGKRIYLLGESPSGGEVTALMGDAGIEVPATALPCASCHGRDGRGRPEGGVEPSDLTWSALTRPYEVTSGNGRRRGPYTPRLLTRAIGLGIDAAGNELDSVMPRYRMSHEDSSDLVAYLRKLGQDRDPGVDEDALHLGILLPPRGAPGSTETAAALGRVTDAYARRANADGGVYGRQLRLHYEVLPEDPATWPATVERFVAETPLFALVASYTAGADAPLADTAERLAVPLVGPLTLYPDESFPLNRQVFYLDGGLPAQAMALVKAAAERAASRRRSGDDTVLAVIYPQGGDLAAVAEAEAGQAEATFSEVIRVSYAAGHLDAPASVGRLRAAGAHEVLLVTPDSDAVDLLAAVTSGAPDSSWAPHVSAPGSLAAGIATSGATPGTEPAFKGPLSLAYTTLPGDRTAAGVERLHSRLGIEEQPSSLGNLEIHAFLAMDMLLYGLEATGRDLTREGLIERLELIRGRPTGLSQPFSYGPNRRVGVDGAYVVELQGAGGGEAVKVRWLGR